MPLDPAEGYMLAVETLARVKALETFVILTTAEATGRPVAALEARLERLVVLARERLWRRLGHDAIAMQAMLDAMGIDLPPREGPESPSPPQT